MRKRWLGDTHLRGRHHHRSQRTVPDPLGSPGADTVLAGDKLDRSGDEILFQHALLLISKRDTGDDKPAQLDFPLSALHSQITLLQLQYLSIILT